MTVCTIDNPDTCCREAWLDGKLIAHVSEQQMYTKGFDGSPHMFFGLSVGREFVPGRVFGDIKAMGRKAKP